jgi:serine/threonine protein phosphatase PrpC
MPEAYLDGLLQDHFIVHTGAADGLTVLGVCDGHHGQAAAQFCSEEFVPELQKGLAGLTCSFAAGQHPRI